MYVNRRAVCLGGAFLSCSIVVLAQLPPSFTEFPTPTSSSAPRLLTVGPDGALWFAEYQASKIGRISTAGTLTEYPTPTASSGPYGITAGPDGALWFTESVASQIGRITTTGTITEYPTSTASSGPSGITAGLDARYGLASPP
jgi:virginiamycin B lyase